MATPSLEKAIRALLEPEIAGGMSAFEDVEILLAAWQEMHRERVVLRDAVTALLDCWDMSSDVLGPEWGGLAERVEALREATNGS